MGWNEERIETLTTMWREGHSAAQIAISLKGFTRAAVMGKLFRLGLQRGESRPAKPLRKFPKYKRPAPVPLFASAPLPPEPPMPAAPALRLSIFELTDATCKCGLGDPKHSDFAFCGLPVKPGSSYCPMHHKAMYSVSRTKRERKRSSIPKPFELDRTAESYEQLLRAA